MTYYHLTPGEQTHVSYVGFNGITVGQAHLLDDVIDNLEDDRRRETSATGGSYYERRTFTYALGVEHALYSRLRASTQ